MSQFIKRPSPGTVIASIALFVALGGTAAALRAGGGSNGKIVAYAQVKANGDVKSSHSLHIGNGKVFLESTSAYCFKNIPKFKGAQVTINYAGTSDGAIEQAEFAKGHPFSDCNNVGPAGVVAEVTTSDGTTFKPEPFYVEFYK